ncbi:unnamed protein product [Rotaria sordida]|uniref:Uncharacterized protein n=1 Tax=Rotaria sordida TaxID=392033 RepID=A0A815JZ23_9BILA|nr:unnamed protein product [Rotaria sordida]CAF1384263.1 unnamed protein product [Rotaria sordida]CAF3831164.1 unnamed protein product [Rotaria sordida]CAF3951814.1 unnamed protein product [Rotaria sordida]
MPIEVGLSSSQQDSFEQHEELSKLLNETDVFYVPLRNEFGDNSLNTNQDLTEITKRFDEDLSNKHLIVTFRDIGYSLFLDSVESIPDENDQSKIRVSGKMIVDGICVQFFGCFDYGNKTRKHSDSHTQQINGVGRVELDEKYYQELSSTQISSRSNIKEENKDEKQKHSVEPIIIRRTRQQTAKLKQRAETMTLINKPQTRSRTISESTLPKNRTSISTSPPPPLPIPITLPHSSISTTTTRSHIHSPSHMPYPLRSPRTKQHRASSPLHFPSSSSTSRNSDTQSSLISTAPTAFTEYPLINSTTTTTSLPSTEPSQSHRVHFISHSPHFSSPTTGHTTMPIQIPSSSNTGVPTTSLPQLTNLFPLSQSHSLPTYFLPTGNIAYITTATSTTNPSGTPFDLTSLTGNTSLLLITSPTQHPTQPIQILTPIDHRSFQFAHYTPTNLFVPPPVPPPPPPIPPTRVCNILQSTSTTNESMSILQNKRHENEEDKQIQRSLETNKQSTDQLPFKKRRYTGQQSRMSNIHNDDDDVSDESVKK